MNNPPTAPNPNAPANAPAPTGPHPARPAAAPARPATPSRREAPPATRDEHPTKAIHWILLAAVVVVAVVLRLQEPLSSPLIGAEDPYRHMERTWDLVQGKGFADYPPGLNLVLLPFTFLGPDAFYVVSMFIPIAFAAVMVVGVFLLGRNYIHPSGALVSAALVAVMPESIRRTTLLFPTALDLAILPFLLLAILRVAEGSRKALVPAGVLAAFLLIAHPWVFALLVPPVAVFAVVVAWRRYPERRKAVLGAGAALALVGIAVVAMRTRALEILANPAELGSLPLYVDLPAMLTLPALLLASIGLVLAVRSRNPFHLLGLLWVALLLPLVLVDWLGLWYVPHRVVVYLGLGIAMLGGVPVGELQRLLRQTKPQAQPGVTFGAVGLALLVMTPSGWGVGGDWYRIFSEDELEAWNEIADWGTPFVMTGSWESRAGYRAVTGREANFNPNFFNNPLDRQIEMRNHPDLLVLIDCHTHREGQDTSFLAAEGWTLVKEWGDPSCTKNAQTGMPMGWTAAYRKE